MLGPLALLAAVAAPAAPASLAGTWQGTVGTLPVRACFVHQENGTFGAYYYLSRLRLIALEADEHGGGFHEGGERDPPPRWAIDSAGPTQLSARWTDGGRTLPIRLTRLSRPVGDESPCASLAFHRPRLEGVRTVTTRAAKDGVSYTHIALDLRGRFESSYESFALDGAGEATARINAALGEALAGDPPSWFECVHDSLGFTPFEGGFTESLAPTLISRRWLEVAHHWDGDCGGAHPDSSNVFRTFELASGREIDLHDWLNDRAVHRERVEGGQDELKSLLPAFRDAILVGWRPENPDCDEAVRGEEFWTIGLTRTGLVFSPQLAHVVQACEEDFAMPLARLQPFLTPQGAENLRSLAAEPVPAAR